MQANRNGFFYVLDRTDGTFLLGEPFIRQTWAKGIDAKGRPIVLPNTDPTEEGVVVCPSAGGGTNWYSASYNPLSKLFYIKATESCAVYKKSPEKFEMGRRFFGGTASGYGDRKRSIRAIDPQTGKVAWDLPVSEGGRVSAGVLSTGGGLVFFGEDSGALVAADAKTGKVLWKTQLNQGWWASPMTYMVGGKQYVSLGGPAGFFTFGLGEQASRGWARRPTPTGPSGNSKVRIHVMGRHYLVTPAFHVILKISKCVRKGDACDQDASGPARRVHVAPAADARTLGRSPSSGQRPHGRRAEVRCLLSLLSGSFE
jgi:glucose dehydrogenase